MKQETFTDIEYSYRKKKTKREEFLEIMEEIIPWDEWVGVIEPYYPKGKRGRPPMGIEKMLRMYLLQIWFNLSDPATEDAIYDSYAMRKFTGIDFMTETVPDETTLCKFRHLLETNGLNKLFFDACCFSERMRKLFRKNEKNVLRFCNKKAKEKRRLQRVKKPM